MDRFNSDANLALSWLSAMLDVLGRLSVDESQAGTVRVAAAKALIDFALKLDEKREPDNSAMDKLDKYLADFETGAFDEY